MEMVEEKVEEEERIFVGGLGESVTKGDVEKTFSSLGTIKGIEFIRTNGRSFAYMDFQPFSLKSLSNLFSTYNGCVWKGGRLRLEKAKEHYLVRWRQEWEEDVELAQKTNDELVEDDENMDTSKKSKLLTPEKTQLRIFFPRFRKVKSLPYSGSGKHKYSFQRMEVPSLPIHFCDCEEHCVSSETAKVKQISALEDQTGKVNEEELNMMRSVMNKIFKRGSNSSTEYNRVRVPTEVGNSNQSIDDFPSNGIEEDEENDPDNLVINTVNGRNTSELGLMENWGLEKVDQESKVGQRQKRNNDDPVSSSDITSKKKPRLLPSDGSNRDDLKSTKPKKNGHLESYAEKSKGLIEAQHAPKGSIQQLTAGLSWRQKSSWKKLVGETANSSFSISHILSDANTKQISPKPNGFDTASSTDSKRLKPVKKSRCKSAGSEPLALEKDEILQESVISDSVSIVAPSEPSKESDIRKEAQPTDQKASPNQTTKNQSWIQKSSWRELVGEMDNSLFSISCILPDIASKRQNLQKCSRTGTVNAIDSEQQNVDNQFTNEFTGNGSNNISTGEFGIVQDKATLASNMASSAKEEETLAGLENSNNKVEKDTQTEKIDNIACSKPSGSETISPSTKGAPVEISIGEVCTFMRSKESEREWMKIKTALSGTLKKETKRSNDTLQQFQR